MRRLLSSGLNEILTFPGVTPEAVIDVVDQVVSGGGLVTTKGQLISECIFDFLNFPKNQ